MRWRDAFSFWANVRSASASGIWPGFISAQTASEPLNSVASSSPGNTPATNSLAMDTSAATPYTIMMMDGGISSPSVAEPPSEPMTLSMG